MSHDEQKTFIIGYFFSNFARTNNSMQVIKLLSFRKLIRWIRNHHLQVTVNQKKMGNLLKQSAFKVIFMFKGNSNTR
ncbi:hypothetical protein CGI28_16760 [Vibrio parahaemolyticus]|nr:hypothetical protein CGI70_23530 [Vibrio parahaemolyticus]TOJ61033.1 hypothetical protein CGI35_16625 [Vibrio parahaemolyticus]TOK13185.1 hypothetical protein CGI28_16760 [Vibrio parahaemolyticus]